MTATARVAKAAPDGYQFVLGTSGTHAANQTLSKHPLYNAATDFTPVALVADQPVLLVARKDLPADTLPQFIAYAKVNQARMQYGSAGPGSGTHLACVRLNLALGIDVAHVHSPVRFHRATRAQDAHPMDVAQRRFQDIFRRRIDP